MIRTRGLVSGGGCRSGVIPALLLDRAGACPVGCRGGHCQRSAQNPVPLVWELATHSEPPTATVDSHQPVGS